jgi:hypothetical protein
MVQATITVSWNKKPTKKTSIWNNTWNLTVKRLQWTFFMLHTVVRKYKTAQKYPCCENRRYSMFYVCHYSWLLTSISFPPFFVIVQPLLRCVTQKVAQSAQHNVTRQNIVQHLYVFSAKREKPKPHHDRLHCDMKNIRPGTDRMTVKLQYQHWDTIPIIKPTRCTDFWNLFLEWNSTCFGEFLCP